MAVYHRMRFKSNNKLHCMKECWTQMWILVDCSWFGLTGHQVLTVHQQSDTSSLSLCKCMTTFLPNTWVEMKMFATYHCVFSIILTQVQCPVVLVSGIDGGKLVDTRYRTPHFLQHYKWSTDHLYPGAAGSENENPLRYFMSICVIDSCMPKFGHP